MEKRGCNIQDEISEEAYQLLYRLGVTANYTGFFHTAYAVRLCAEQLERLLLVTKWLYPEVAKQYNTNWRAVERNIRKVGDIIWCERRVLLEELAGRQLKEKPRTAQLLAILAEVVKKKGPQAESSQPEVGYEMEEVKQGCGR